MKSITLALLILCFAAVAARAQDGHEYAPLQEKTVNYKTWLFQSLKDDKPVDLRTVAQGSLLLFDRGYFSFPWFDALSRQGYWWISRWREKTRYSLVHVYYQHGETFDGLIWLGATRDQAAWAVRLVQFRLGSTLYRYLTNVRDPLALPLADIARLYARRWDIELAFRLLKEHLGLRLLFSAKLLVIQQQCLACLLFVQLLQAFQVELAARIPNAIQDESVEIKFIATGRLRRTCATQSTLR